MTVQARTSETSVDNYFTRQYIPEDKYELHTRRRENLKSHTPGVGVWKGLVFGEVDRRFRDAYYLRLHKGVSLPWQ
jgi:hypothetical protein